MKLTVQKLTLSACIAAAISTQTVAAIDPAGVEMGPVSLIPLVTVQTGYDDNIFSTSSNELSSIVSVISPSVQLIAEDGLNAYRATYQLSRGIYDKSSVDNYLDHLLSAEAHLEFSQRSLLDLKAAYNRGHEARGTGLSATGGLANAITSPLEYDTKAVSFNYQYGANDATGRIQLYGEHLKRDYKNFRTITEGRDATEVTAGAVFYYRVMPKTSLLFEARNKDIDYDLDPANSLDSNAWKYFVGATWDTTAKTTGTVKIGYATKDFDSAAREDFSGNSWEAAVRWSPRTYSVVDISTGRQDKESSGNGDFIDAKTFNVNWNHAWNDQFNSDLGFGLSTEKYEGAADGREDDLTNLNLGLNYDMRRWLTVGFSYTYSDTDSNLANTDFDKNVYMVTVNASL